MLKKASLCICTLMMAMSANAGLQAVGAAVESRNNAAGLQAVGAAVESRNNAAGLQAVGAAVESRNNAAGLQAVGAAAEVRNLVDAATSAPAKNASLLDLNAE